MVLAIGGSASVGKTTLARALAERLDLDRVVHVDDLKTKVESAAGPSFIDSTPDVWSKPAKWLCGSLVASTRKLHPAIVTAIAALEKRATGGVVEGEGIEPPLFCGRARSRVRSVYVIETDAEQLRETFAQRPSAARFLALTDAQQDAVVEMNRMYGAWLRREADQHHQPWVPSRPWHSLTDRALTALDRW